MLLLLLNNNPKLNIKNHKGMTAYEYADDIEIK